MDYVFSISPMILWILYSCADGLLHGHFFAYGNAHNLKERLPYNIHYIVMVPRSVAAAACCMPFWDDPVQVGLVLMCFAMVFSFLHNGVYYEMRRLLEPNLSHYGWTYHSPQSNAKFRFTYFWRIALFIWAIPIYLIVIGIL